MTTNAADMLRLLGSGVRPAGVSATSAGAAQQSQTFEGATFAELLAGVQKGEVASNEPLNLKNLLEGRLTPEQLSRLSTATDAAEAAGASRVLAVIDNQAVTIDVDSRTIESMMPWVPGGVHTDVDAVITVPDEGAPTDTLFTGIGAAAQAVGSTFAGLARSGSKSLHDLLASLTNPAAPAPSDDQTT